MKALWTEIKDLNKWRYGVHGLEDSILQILSVLSKVIYRFNFISNKNSKTHQDFFVEHDKMILKFIWTCKRPRIAKSF